MRVQIANGVAGAVHGRDVERRVSVLIGGQQVGALLESRLYRLDAVVLNGLDQVLLSLGRELSRLLRSVLVTTMMIAMTRSMAAMMWPEVRHKRTISSHDSAISDQLP